MNLKELIEEVAQYNIKISYINDQWIINSSHPNTVPSVQIAYLAEQQYIKNHRESLGIKIPNSKTSSNNLPSIEQIQEDFIT